MGDWTWGLVAMASLYGVGGVMHFLKPGFYRPMMPPYIPMPDLMIGLSGIAEIGLGLLLLPSATRPFAAWGVIALLFAVWPANIHAALHPETMPKVSSVALWVRVPLQLPLMYWAYRYT